MPAGTLKTWNADRGFGFIAVDGARAELVLHISDLKASGIDPDGIRIGDRLTFETVRARKGGMKAGRVRRAGHTPSDRAEGEEMNKPGRSSGGQFTKREIVLFVFVMLVATFVTVEGTLFVVKTLVIGNPNNPLTKTGGLSPFQDREMRKGK